MSKLTSADIKVLASALYDWRQSYIKMEQDQEVLKARQSLERAKKRLEKAENLHKIAIERNEKHIRELLPLVGKSVVAFGIRAKFTKGYARASYDTKVLDRIAEENTRLRNLIMPHRKETPVKPRVNVEVAEPETLLQEVKFTPVLEI